jgi:endonuclease YncB( thermonuclease family)
MLEAFVALVLSVHDGDSIRVRTDAGVSLPVRVAYIDAPEVRNGRWPTQPYGRASARSLRALCLGQQAAIRPQTTDRYGRTVAEVECKRKDASTHQVRAGMAWVFWRHTPAGSPLAAIESEAKAARRGLWAQDAPEEPGAYRARFAIAPTE